MHIEQPQSQPDIAPVCVPAKFIITFSILSSFKQCTSVEKVSENNAEVNMSEMESWNL